MVGLEVEEVGGGAGEAMGAIGEGSGGGAAENSFGVVGWQIGRSACIISDPTETALIVYFGRVFFTLLGGGVEDLRNGAGVANV